MESLATPDRALPDEIGRQLISALEEGTYTLPVFPRVAQRVLEMANDERYGPTDLARMVEKDAALCGRLVAAASSALYGSSRVVSVKQAVARLGTSEVAMLTTTLALRGAIFLPGPFDAALAECWRAGVGTALFAKEIARARRCSVDTAFLCGLFHRIGRPIALDLMTRLDVSCSEETALSVAAEHETALGTMAVASWGLGPAVAAVVENLGVANPAPAAAEAVFTVQLAAAFDVWAGLRSSDPMQALEASARLDASPAVVALSLYPDQLAAIRDRADAIVLSLEVLA